MLHFHSPKSSIGLEFSESSISVVEVHTQQGVIARVRIPLNEGIIVRGLVADKKRLADKIREAVRKLPKPPGAAHALLPERITYLHSFPADARLSETELEQTVQKETEGIIPLAPGLFYYGFIAVPDTTVKNQKIIAYGASEKLAVDAYAQTMRDAGVTPLSLGIKSFSLARAFLTPNTTPTVLVYMGETETSLGIYSGHPLPLLTVSLPVGMRTMIADVSAKRSVSVAQAEEMIRTFGLDYKKPQNTVFLIVQATFQRIINEIRPAIAFYESKYPQQKVGRIIVAGQPALLPRAHEYWEVNMGRKLELGRPAGLAGADSKPDGAPPVMEFASSLGAALGGIHANSFDINLLGGAATNARHSRDYFRLLGSTFAHAHQLAPEIPRTARRTLKLAAVMLLTGAAVGGLGWTIWNYTLTPPPSMPPTTYVSPTSEPSPSEPIVATAASSTSPFPPASSPSAPAASPSPAPSAAPQLVTITDTPTGWLRVRETPSSSAAEIARVLPGETYDLLDEDEGWYHIRLDAGRTGWISAQYAKKK